MHHRILVSFFFNEFAALLHLNHGSISGQIFLIKSYTVQAYSVDLIIIAVRSSSNLSISETALKKLAILSTAENV